MKESKEEQNAEGGSSVEERGEEMIEDTGVVKNLVKKHPGGDKEGERGGESSLKESKADAEKREENVSVIEKLTHQARHKKTLTGKVVSDKMDKTVVVEVERLIKHSIYKKYIKRSRRLKAHDKLNKAKVGEVVKIVECRPYSKEKSFRILETGKDKG